MTSLIRRRAGPHPSGVADPAPRKDGRDGQAGSTVHAGDQRSPLPLLRGVLGSAGVRAPGVGLLAWTEDMPGALRALDVLVLPSHTTATWKEQFGRILVEAMSCAVAVIGSSSGEIPQVLGDAGLIFPEGNSKALSELLLTLSQQQALRQELGRRGRARVLAYYTQAALAARYAEIYRGMQAAG